MTLTIQLAIIQAFAALWDIKFEKIMIVLKYDSSLSDYMYFDWDLEYKSKFQIYKLYIHWNIIAFKSFTRGIIINAALFNDWTAQQLPE